MWFENGIAETDDPDFISAFKQNPTIEALDENGGPEQDEKKSMKRTKGGKQA